MIAFYLKSIFHLVYDKFFFYTSNNTNNPRPALLKAVAEGAVPGIPWSLRILLLGQTRELTAEELLGGLSITDETVLQHVIRSDKVRERLVREAESKSRPPISLFFVLLCHSFE